MLRHGNGPGRQVRSDPKLSILPGSRRPFRRVKGSLRGVRATRVAILTGSLVPAVCSGVDARLVFAAPPPSALALFVEWLRVGP